MRFARSGTKPRSVGLSGGLRIARAGCFGVAGSVLAADCHSVAGAERIGGSKPVARTEQVASPGPSREVPPGRNSTGEWDRRRRGPGTSCLIRTGTETASPKYGL